MRRFLLRREKDPSGVSGTGYVAEGIEFRNGTVVIHWLTGGDGIAIYTSLREAERIHGHNGATKFEIVDTGLLARLPEAILRTRPRTGGSA